MNLTLNSPISRTDLNLPRIQPQEESELEGKLLPGTLIHRFLLSCVFGTLISDSSSFISCVFSGKLLNLSEPRFSQKTDFVFHSQEFIPSKNLAYCEETLLRHGVGLVLKSTVGVKIAKPSHQVSQFILNLGNFMPLQ